MNAVCVFSGPTIGATEISSLIDAQWRPPAAQGDVYLAIRDGADIIILIDGLFQNTPSVWHKEILWGMSNGVTVVGASSMGALRAAELHSFGMVGVGKVFEAYRAGSITCDDEVALLHGPSELDYRPLTTPLVDMRATFRLAVSNEEISVAQHRSLVDVAKALPYWERNYDAVLSRADGVLDADSCRAFMRWLAQYAVNQKHADAVEALRLVASGNTPQRATGFRFQPSSAWRQFATEATSPACSATRTVLSDEDAIALSELRLNPRLHEQLRAMIECDLNADGIPDDDALVRKLAETDLVKELRGRGVDKHGWLIDTFGDDITYASAMTTPYDVYTWFFREHCRIAIPSDLPDYATRHGFANVAELSLALLYEYLYCQSAAPQATAVTEEVRP